MKIDIVTPTEASITTGNEVTGIRWAKILQSLGHQVRLNPKTDLFSPDLLIGIHARRCAQYVQSFRDSAPNRPVIVCLAGTDFNLDLKGLRGPEAKTQASLGMRLADRLIGIHDDVCEEIPERFRSKVEVIIQSAEQVDPKPLPLSGQLEIVFVGNLRSVKDPFIGPEALRSLPESSKVQLYHFGGSFDEKMTSRANKLMKDQPRYHWLGPKPFSEVRQRIARSQLLLMTSIAEGAPNVISEAVACRTPVLTTNIPGATGLVGKDYPGCFPVGDSEKLAEMIMLYENDSDFRYRLELAVENLTPKFLPEREISRWKEVLAKITF